MLTFMLPQIHGLVDATSVIADAFDKLFGLKFSPAMFSIMAPTSPSSRCIIALQLSPQFFQEYFCDRFQYRWTLIEAFYGVIFALERMGFSSLTFSSANPYRAQLKSEDPDGRSQKVNIPLFHRHDLIDVGEFDWGTFVSIDSQDFINIITGFNDFDNVLVTLSNSQVKFSYARTRIIILTPERRQCIIGGVEASNPIIFAITLQPTITFCNLARRSKRVWLFKSNNSCRGVIAAPLGLYARYLAYFPDRT